MSTHGRHATPEYRAWSQMKHRCDNPNNRYYRRYGGRGITYVPEWATFEGFFADMGERPSVFHSLDRINNSLGYSPDNCRWATPIEQLLNRDNYFKRSDDPMRFIRVRKTCYQVRIYLRKRHRIQRSFKSLEEALTFRADCEMEREMHRLLGG